LAGNGVDCGSNLTTTSSRSRGCGNRSNRHAVDHNVAIVNNSRKIRNSNTGNRSFTNCCSHFGVGADGVDSGSHSDTAGGWERVRHTIVSCSTGGVAIDVQRAGGQSSITDCNADGRCGVAAVGAHTQGAGLGTVNRNSNAVIRTVASANLQILPLERTVQQLDAVVSGVVGHAVDFGNQLLGFIVHGGAVAGVVAGVGRLNGQLTDTLQVVTNLGQAALGSLCQGDAVVGVANGCRDAANRCGHAGADG